MNAPRLTVDLQKISHNARSLVTTLGRRGINVTGITKASLGSSDIATTLLQTGVKRLGDSRIENIELMRRAGVTSPMMLIRSPMLSQVDRVVRHADISLNSELIVVKSLSVAAEAAGLKHGIVLMVELGDLREGLMPNDVEHTICQILPMPNIELVGIGTNLACRSGVIPDTENMAQLSVLADTVETSLNFKLEMVSGGNSANLQWAMNDSETGRINDLRLGESILLGCEPLFRKPIPSLYTDAITLVAEVIESKYKPSMPTGALAQTAFGEHTSGSDQGAVAQSILALGRQDIDPAGLFAPKGIEILDASSDHLIVSSAQRLPIGSELTFQLNYSAMLRAMTSSFVQLQVIGLPT